ncbi:protein phosphatase 2C domain-containing protein [Streptomyces sp. CB02923]|uniref:protein phosphatase 2C domain-containing protein n=1 Tax=Streptomyces sp. CB02923 TaxID=1718985 RepID=UPI000A4B8A01|nr:protein phosphatase 2C domain-containing protein [Streptomyces sp. CB02923]
MSTPRWETLTESVQGINKKHNQDYGTAEGQGSAECPLVLAVADGHGAARHARSDVGARRVVDLFTALVREFAGFARALAPEESRGGLSRLMNYAQHDMPRRLVAAWQQDMLGHWDRTRERNADGTPPPAPADAEKLLLYGTTLIGALLTPQLFVAWQLGDGELTVVDRDGRVGFPLAPTETDLGDETESMCSHRAWSLMRVHWAPVIDPDRTPRLIALSTDGLSKSFASHEGFTQFMSGLDQRLVDEGTEGVRAALPQWLRQAARHSGDDTTVAAGRRPPHHSATEE